MRKIIFFIFAIINVIKSFFYLIAIKIAERKGKNEKSEKVFNKLAMRIIKSINSSLRLEIEVSGKENIPDEPCLFVSNHQGNFDPFVIMAGVGHPVGFVVKKELNKMIYIRRWLTLGNCAFIDRKNPREGIKAINAAAETIKGGKCMAIFPEGTRSRGEKIGDFKKGSMKVAIKANAKIVPVSLSGVYKSFEQSKGYGRVKVKVTYGKPIDTVGMPKEERAVLHDRIRDEIIEMKK